LVFQRLNMFGDDRNKPVDKGTQWWTSEEGCLNEPHCKIDEREGLVLDSTGHISIYTTENKANYIRIDAGIGYRPRRVCRNQN
jgi:hypothetical protein